MKNITMKNLMKENITVFLNFTQIQSKVGVLSAKDGFRSGLDSDINDSVPICEL